MSYSRLTTLIRQLNDASAGIEKTLTLAIYQELSSMWRAVYPDVRRIANQKELHKVEFSYKLAKLNIFTQNSLWEKIWGRIKIRVVAEIAAGGLLISKVYEAYDKLQGSLHPVTFTDDFIARSMRNEIGQEISLIEESTRDEIAGKIIKWYNTPGAKLEDIVTDLVSDTFSKSRAESIARTETTNLNSRIADFRADKLGLTEWTWHTMRDEMVCKTHRQKNGKVIQGCRELQGKTFNRYTRQSPPLHVNCVLPGQIVAVPNLSGGMKSFYKGIVIEITTRSGHCLTITPNHPVLTPSGWIKADLLNKGDYVVTHSDPERMVKSVNPHNYQTPSLVEDIFASLEMSGNMRSCMVPITPKDFNGDAIHIQGKIKIIYPKRKLRHRNITGFKQIIKNQILGRIHLSFTKSCLGMKKLFGFGNNSSSSSNMSSFDLRTALLSIHPVPSQKHGFAFSSDMNIMFDETIANIIPSDSITLRKFILRNSGLIKLDEIVGIRNYDFSGHIYDLTSEELGFYTCNGIITHNCRCKKIYHYKVAKLRKEISAASGMSGYYLVGQHDPSWEPSKDKDMKYGGIIFRDGKVLMELTDHDKGWVFPRGTMKEGEYPEATALREVEEETGYACRIVGSVNGFYDQPDIRTYYFLMDPLEYSENAREESEGEVDRIRWVTPTEAAELIVSAKDKEKAPEDRERDLAILHAALQEKNVVKVDGDQIITRSGHNIFIPKPRVQQVEKISTTFYVSNMHHSSDYGGSIACLIDGARANILLNKRAMGLGAVEVVMEDESPILQQIRLPATRIKSSVLIKGIRNEELVGFAREVDWARANGEFVPGKSCRVEFVGLQKTFDPNEPRDETGQWTERSGVARKPEETQLSRPKFEEYKGFQIARKNPHVKDGWLAMYDAKEQGFDDAGGKWVDVCETHHTVCNFKTKELATQHLPTADWCEECMDIAEGKKSAGKTQTIKDASQSGAVKTKDDLKAIADEKPEKSTTIDADLATERAVEGTQGQETETPSGADSFNEWSFQHFGRVYPRTGIFADQYNKYLNDFIPEKKADNTNKIEFNHLENETVSYIKNNFNEIKKYPVLGLRTLREDENYNVGDKTRNSLDWDFENDTSSDIELNGISTLGLDPMYFDTPEELLTQINNNVDASGMGYGSRQIVLIGGYSSSTGDDPSEEIIENGIVLVMIKTSDKTEKQTIIDVGGSVKTLVKPTVGQEKIKVKEEGEEKTPWRDILPL